MILSQFQTVGRDLFTRGLVSSHSGNLSIRLGDRLIITRRGCRLGCLEEHYGSLSECVVNVDESVEYLKQIKKIIIKAGV